jgi:hypothetical protein
MGGLLAKPRRILGKPAYPASYCSFLKSIDEARIFEGACGLAVLLAFDGFE